MAFEAHKNGKSLVINYDKFREEAPEYLKGKELEDAIRAAIGTN